MPKGKKLTGKQLLSIINEVVKSQNILVTDEFKSYNILKDTEHFHFKVNHKEAYALGDVHTNSIESFWATLKRGILGIYHHVSVEYLQNYINEFCFRYNNRVSEFPNLTNPAVFDLVLKQAVLI